MRALTMDEQYVVNGGFMITPEMIEALIKLGICVAGAIKLLSSKKGRIKLPFVEIEWSLKNQSREQVLSLLNNLS